jgi:hypothetical protein
MKQQTQKGTRGISWRQNRQEQTQNCSLTQDQRSFLWYHVVFFMIQMWLKWMFFARKVLTPTNLWERSQTKQFAWKVWSGNSLWKRFKTKEIYKERSTLSFEQFVSFEFCGCCGLGGELLASRFVVLVMSCNFVNKELQQKLQLRQLRASVTTVKTTTWSFA